MNNLPNRKSFNQAELKTAPDAHHGGFSHWGWDGQHIWIKAGTTPKKWTRVKSIKLTHARIDVILKLTGGQLPTYIAFKKGSDLICEI